jgi:hypothetical protein
MDGKKKAQPNEWPGKVENAAKKHEDSTAECRDIFSSYSAFAKR